MNKSEKKTVLSLTKTKLYVLLLSVLPIFTFAQDHLFTDKANRTIVDTDCEGKVFTKVETLPFVSEGEAALSDSLTSYLKNNKVRIKDGKGTLKLLVTTKSQLVDIVTTEGYIPKEKVFKQALLTYSSMWRPALQNSHAVCALIYLQVDCTEGKVAVTIKPYDRRF